MSDTNILASHACNRSNPNALRNYSSAIKSSRGSRKPKCVKRSRVRTVHMQVRVDVVTNRPRDRILSLGGTPGRKTPHRVPQICVD